MEAAISYFVRHRFPATVMAVVFGQFFGSLSLSVYHAGYAIWSVIAVAILSSGCLAYYWLNKKDKTMQGVLTITALAAISAFLLVIVLLTDFILTDKPKYEPAGFIGGLIGAAILLAGLSYQEARPTTKTEIA